jgi:hypothetical protein
MQKFLRRGAELLSPRTSSPATTDDDENYGFRTARTQTALFPKVDPQVDGEDCDHDCASCTVHYPARFDVEMSDKLYGHVKGWATHVLVATGKADWVRDVADEKGSVMEAIDKGGLTPSNGVCFTPSSRLFFKWRLMIVCAESEAVCFQYPGPR